MLPSKRSDKHRFIYKLFFPMKIITITLIKLKLEAKVEWLGKVYRLLDSFDQALELLREFGIGNQISTRNLAYARIN